MKLVQSAILYRQRTYVLNKTRLTDKEQYLNRVTKTLHRINIILISLSMSAVSDILFIRTCPKYLKLVTNWCIRTPVSHAMVSSEHISCSAIVLEYVFKQPTDLLYAFVNHSYILQVLTKRMQSLTKLGQIHLNQTEISTVRFSHRQSNQIWSPIYWFPINLVLRIDRRLTVYHFSIHFWSPITWYTICRLRINWGCLMPIWLADS